METVPHCPLLQKCHTLSQELLFKHLPDTHSPGLSGLHSGGQDGRRTGHNWKGRFFPLPSALPHARSQQTYPRTQPKLQRKVLLLPLNQQYRTARPFQPAIPQDLENILLIDWKFGPWVFALWWSECKNHRGTSSDRLIQDRKRSRYEHQSARWKDHHQVSQQQISRGSSIDKRLEAARVPQEQRGHQDGHKDRGK